MTTKIGLISDVHATPAPLEEALSIFLEERVDLICCAGDIAGYGGELERTVELLVGSQCNAVSGWYHPRDLRACGFHCQAGRIGAQAQSQSDTLLITAYSPRTANTVRW